MRTAFSGAVHLQSRASVRSQNVHRHVTSGCIGMTDIWRACPTNFELKKITSNSVIHPLMEGLSREDPLAGSQVFHDCLEVSKTLSPLENAQVGSGLGPFGVQMVLGELSSKKATPFSRGLERA